MAGVSNATAGLGRTGAWNLEEESTTIYRIRFHGRGGQGMKTASRILGTAFFLEGFEVQDAPRYGAERRGAPIFAYIRASRHTICERGVIRHPDLVVVADETLVPVPAAEVLAGVTEKSVLLINSSADPASWKDRLAPAGRVLTLPVAVAKDTSEVRFIGAVCAGAAARLVGTVSRSSLEQAIKNELAHLGEAVVAKNLAKALEPYDLMAPYEGCVAPGAGIPADDFLKPDWVDLPFDVARVSAPAVFAPATSGRVRTGLWRTVRPVVDHGKCSRCWLCSTFCPEGAITVDADGYPAVDYDHCKGCLICMAQCPSHAIRQVAERDGTATGGRLKPGEGREEGGK
jgi:pyruvate ferredoxin oxidoreductase gamma subunit